MVAWNILNYYIYNPKKLDQQEISLKIMKQRYNEHVIFDCLTVSRIVWILIRHHDIENTWQWCSVLIAQIQEHWLQMTTENVPFRSHGQAYSIKAMMFSWTKDNMIRNQSFSTSRKACSAVRHKYAISPELGEYLAVHCEYCSYWKDFRLKVG